MQILKIKLIICYCTIFVKIISVLHKKPQRTTEKTQKIHMISFNQGCNFIKVITGLKNLRPF